ncbi:MAG: serine protein kinase PrkA [Polyangiaceae bacterium]|nr:serine protein kinase PrkA [Polyangiaceae bacterium]
MERRFADERRVLSFGEYLALFASDPVRYSRFAGQYLRDMLDHFGRDLVDRPSGQVTRFRLFDLSFLEDREGQRRALAGHEQVQAELYRVLENFVREGRANRVILLHGPNGSAKSTIAHALMRGLEWYSTLDEGALYRFHWVFPRRSAGRGVIGFRGEEQVTGAGTSYAHLSDEETDARLFVETRDHPLFLIPERERAELLDRVIATAGVQDPPTDFIRRGGLSHKNRQIFDALLASYGGALTEVLRHVRVERYFISRRYRVGAVTLGPEIGVDAHERQITSDRSLAALPASLQSLSLFEAFGDLVDATGGLLEFSDLLKRPLDAFKYLQITAETGEVQLETQNLQTNCVMLASGNELHLSAFREHHEFESFRGRLELVRVPYLLSYLDEQRIYDAQVAPQVERHVAPHATEIAAMFAVLTRMRKPDPERYSGQLQEAVEGLTAVEKLDLYATGAVPKRLAVEAQQVLRANVGELLHETDGSVDYEGAMGASPREMRGVLLDAAQDVHYAGLSPFSVLSELERLCTRRAEYAWLGVDPKPGGYHDHQLFRRVLKDRLLDLLEDEFRVATGLVDEASYDELFDRYLTQVSGWLSGEKMRHAITGWFEDPDERLMGEVELLLGVTADTKVWREALLGRIAAWAIDHPGRPLDRRAAFDDLIHRLREGVFRERRPAVGRACRDLVILVRDSGSGLDDARQEAAQRFLERLCHDVGYVPETAADAAHALVQQRYRDVLG